MTQVQYNAYEQSRIDSYERLKAKRQANPESVTLKELEEARVTVENLKHNAQLRAARWAKQAAARETKRAAEAEAAEESWQKRVAAEVAAFKEKARANFPGTATEFEAQWPTINAEWQRRRALGEDLDSDLERARAEQRATGRYNQF